MEKGYINPLFEIKVVDTKPLKGLSEGQLCWSSNTFYLTAVLFIEIKHGAWKQYDENLKFVKKTC